MTASLRARFVSAFAIAVWLLGSALAPGQAVAAPATPAAQIFTVNTTNDAAADFTGDPNFTLCQTAPANGFCSLRAAVMNANRHLGGATINLPAGVYPLQVLPVPPDDDSTGDLNITNMVTLIGAGAAGTIVDGGGADGVFKIASGAVFTLTGVTVRNGHATLGGGLAGFGQIRLSDSVVSGNHSDADGGGLYTVAPASLTNVTVQGNVASGQGGGLAAVSTTTLSNVTIEGNQATVAAGGLYAVGSVGLTQVTVEDNISDGNGGGIETGGTVTLTDSTVDNNRAAGGDGGGLDVFGRLTVFNSTISNNSTVYYGGGLINHGSIQLFQTTIAGNLADSGAHGGYVGGGLFNFPAQPVQLWNTLLADNYLSNTLNDCNGGPLTSEDYNYFETTDGCTISRAAGITHDLTGTDPLLASLAFNGGPTETRALLPGSPSLDQIPPSLCRDPAGAAPVPDQRGVPRPINGLCDIGAYEGHLPGAGFLRNLVRNGDAEAAAGSFGGSFIGVPDWRAVIGQLLTVVPYNAPGGFPVVPTDTVPANHGYNFFAGGVSAVALGLQNVDVSPLAGPIDEGGVSFDLSADLGGYDGQNDNAKLEANFRDGTRHLLMQTVLGPVTAADRGGQTGLLPRFTNGSVPVNTRTVELIITLTNAGVDYNDGYADNISLVLLPRSALFLPALMR